MLLILLCKAIFLFFIAVREINNNTAVIPFVVAYMGGKNDSDSTLGILIVNSNATARGIAIDKTIIQGLNFFSSGVVVLVVILLIILKYLVLILKFLLFVHHRRIPLFHLLFLCKKSWDFRNHQVLI